jgi:hypothetical protein
MFTLDFQKCRGTNLRSEDWRDEIENETAFPMVNVDQLELKNGYSSAEIESPLPFGYLLRRNHRSLVGLRRQKEAVVELKVVEASSKEDEKNPFYYQL